MIFRVQEEEYALPLGTIRDVFEHLKITKDATAPEFMEGSVLVQGFPIPVIRLSAKFGLIGDKPALRQVLIVDIGSQEIGIVVDEIMGVLRLPVARIEPSLLGHSCPGSCIAGFGKIGNRLIILLDIARLFSDDELTAFNMAGRLSTNL